MILVKNGKFDVSKLIFSVYIRGDFNKFQDFFCTGL